MSINLKSLIGKLNRTTRNAMEAAAGLCDRLRFVLRELRPFFRFFSQE